MQRHFAKLRLGLILVAISAVVPTRAGTLQGTVRDAITNAALSNIWVSVLQGPDPG